MGEAKRRKMTEAIEDTMTPETPNEELGIKISELLDGTSLPDATAILISPLAAQCLAFNPSKDKRVEAVEGVRATLSLMLGLCPGDLPRHNRPGESTAIRGVSKT